MIKTFMDTAIDSVQTSKKMFVDAVVKHEGLATSLNKFVDAQTAYTKKAVEATLSVGTEVYKTVTDKAFYSEALKTAQDSVSSVLPKKGK